MRRLMLLWILAVGFAAMGGTARVPVTDTFALAGLANEQQAQTIAAGRSFTVPRTVNDLVTLKIFLPAIATGEWKVPGWKSARCRADRVTAEIVRADNGTPFVLGLDAWHQLTYLCDGRVLLNGKPVGTCGAGPLTFGGGAMLYLADVRTYSALDPTAKEFVEKGVPPPVVRQAWTGGARTIVRGISRPIAHRLPVSATTPYTLVADVTLPSTSWNAWRCVYTTSLSQDASMCVSPQNLFGIGGKYHNVGLKPGASRRVAMSFDGRGHGTLACNGQTLMTIDLPKAAIVEPVFYVSGDESGEDGELDVMQVMIFDQALSPAQMAALGGCGK